MHKIVFVCHGNICRSPTAQYLLEHLVSQAGRKEEFFIDSAATSDDEIGNPIYPPSRRKLQAEGIPVGNHRATRLTRQDYDRFALIIGMDQQNRQNILRIVGGDPQGKVHLLLDYTPHPASIADPWFTGDFDLAYDEILRGCQGLLASLTEGR